MKHFDIRYKYVNEFVEDEIVKIAFVKSAESDNDLLTKNLSRECHSKYTKKIIVETPN